MDSILRCSLLVLLTLCLGGNMMASGANSTNPLKPVRITVRNNCSYNIWPGVQASPGYQAVTPGGFSLSPNQTKSFNISSEWQGHIWARTGCRFNASATGFCVTGDCGGMRDCNGRGGANPKTVAELSLHFLADDVSSYTVSLSNGFNVPLAVAAFGGRGRCGESMCTANLLKSCPREMQVTNADKEVIACKSACQAFRTDMYCCTNEYNNSTACKADEYTLMLKRACRFAFAYPYDSSALVHRCVQPREIQLLFCH